MRNCALAILALALAACGSERSEELIPPEPYEIGNYSIPAGVSLPDDVQIYGRGSQTLNDATQVSLSFVTGLSTEELIAFFAEKNMHLEARDDDTYHLYEGSLGDGSELRLQFDKEPAGADGETIYTLIIGNATVDIPLSADEAA